MDSALSMVKVPARVKVVDNCGNVPMISVDVAKVSRVFVNLIIKRV